MSPVRNGFQPLAQRFWAKVKKGDSCWEWTGYRDQDGYGRIILSGPRTSSCARRLAHRVSWEMHRGPIPEGMQVCHRCDNAGCVRPDHLFLGSAVENQLDKVAKGRQARGERHGFAALTEAAVLELRRRFASGPTNDCHLAREYGVGRACIRHLRVGLTWRHLPGAPTDKPPPLRIGRPPRMASAASEAQPPPRPCPVCMDGHPDDPLAPIASSTQEGEK